MINISLYCKIRRLCKISSSKKIDLERDFTSGAYLSEAQNPIPLTPFHIRVYSMLIHSERGGEGESWTREKDREANFFHKAGSKIPIWLTVYLLSTNSDKHQPLSPFTCQFFKITTFCFGVYVVNLSMVSIPSRCHEACSDLTDGGTTGC
jgi:hypothetical protein